MKLASLDAAAHASPGAYRAPCPECDRGPRDDAVSVTIETDGFVAFCHRCSWRASTRQASPARAPERRHRVREHDGLAEWAAELWRSTRAIDGSAVDYLTARACVIPPADSDLRWHPNVRHAPANYSGPALVGLVTDAITSKPISVHRTWILPDGNKAPVKPARLLAAGHRARGGVIRLWPDDCVTYGLAVSEGVETALSVAHAFTPAWACIDAGNLAGFPALNGIESLLIAADGDPVGRAAADTCASRWLAAGREVAIVDPGEGMDWNDEVAA